VGLRRVPRTVRRQQRRGDLPMPITRAQTPACVRQRVAQRLDHTQRSTLNFSKGDGSHGKPFNGWGCPSNAGSEADIKVRIGVRNRQGM